jgi:hypothetical protein
MTFKSVQDKFNHLPRLSITFFIVSVYCGAFILTGITSYMEGKGFMVDANMATRIGDAFYLVVAYYLGNASRTSRPSNEDETKN